MIVGEQAAYLEEFLAVLTERTVRSHVDGDALGFRGPLDGLVEPSRMAKRRTAQEKLELVMASYLAENVRVFCEERGIDRSHLYVLRRELEQAALDFWSGRKVGRPAKPPTTSERLREDLAKARAESRALKLKLARRRPRPPRRERPTT